MKKDKRNDRNARTRVLGRRLAKDLTADQLQAVSGRASTSIATGVNGDCDVALN